MILGHAGSLPPVPAAAQPRDQALPGDVYRRQIEEDWLEQAKALQFGAESVVTTRSDARGGCDGVKDGKYGFHTEQQAAPWWQVDLGKSEPLSRVVVFNRLDYAPGLHNADRLRLLTSEDGQEWVLRHEQKGQFFGGVSLAPPLEVALDSATVRARYVRLELPSKEPVFFHLDEVEVYGPAGNNLALHQPADQSSMCYWSTAKPPGGALAAPVYPTARFLESARKLAVDLGNAGQDCSPTLASLGGIEQRLRALPADATDPVRRTLYLEARWAVRALVFSHPLLNFDRLLFVKRFTQETYPDVCLNHMPWVSRPGGDLAVLAAPAGRSLASALARPDASGLRVRHLLNRALGPGHVHGMDLGWDGSRVVFGYARAAADEPVEGWLDRSRSYHFRRTIEPIHIFEMDVDGKNLRQLTFGEWSDLDPTYAPNGDIVFVSERCGTSLQCNEYDKDETSCNLYVMKPDGSGIRRLSVNKDGDYLPHTLDDGNVAYTRWEYHERSWALIQSLWIIRPDGTGADAIFKQHFANPWAIEDARSIPGSPKLVAVAAGHHTLPVGPIIVVDHAAGVNEPKGIAIVTPDVKPTEGGMDGVPVTEGGVRDGRGLYMNPWALSEKLFLASYTYSNKETDPIGYGLYLVDVFGNKELVYRDPAISCSVPMPLRPRPRPPVYPDLVDLAKAQAVCVVSDASLGSEGIAPAQARYLRIAEPVGWPYDNEHGGQRFGEDHRYGGPDAARKNLLNWTPVRILGDVPIESDGSAHFEVPADTAVYFQLLDENRRELRRMRSFISFQPGEVRACVGCHESRALAPVSARPSLAASRPPVHPVLPPWGDRTVSFLRDIQPVFDRNCVSCHSGLKPPKQIDFSGGLTSHDAEVAGYGYNRAFETIIAHDLVALSKARAQDASITPPLAYGALKSKLLAVLQNRPHDTAVRLPEEDRLRLSLWIDANAPYHDRFVNKRPPQQAYDLPGDQGLLREITAVHERRCAACHPAGAVSRLDWIDLRQPERSRFLAAPLASAPIEPRRCEGAVYPNELDPDYAALRRRVEAAVKKAWENPRRDVQALVEARARERRAEAGAARGE